MTTHPIVSKDDWLAARRVLLGKEKAASKAREELTAARAALPWVEVETPYTFAGERGAVTTASIPRLSIRRCTVSP